MSAARQRRRVRQRARYAARCEAIGGVAHSGRRVGRALRRAYVSAVRRLAVGLVIDPALLLAKGNGKTTELSERLAAMHETGGYEAMWSSSDLS